MTMEEALAVIQKIADAWNAFGQAIENAAQAIQDMFRGCIRRRPAAAGAEQNGRGAV